MNHELSDAGHSPGEATGDSPEIAKAKAARKDERFTKRHPCSGRVTASTPDGRSVEGRMHEVSMSGACVLIDNRIAFTGTTTLNISVYKSGMLHNIKVRARFVHASLAGQNGFKHGFEFESVDEATSKSLNILTQLGPLGNAG